MARARRRRRFFLAESPEEDGDDVPVHGRPEEWRDWANLLPELADDISGRVLSLDVAAYIRFRAACKPWRDLTADLDPRDSGVLDRSFRPRNWAVFHLNPEATPPRRLLNLATVASLTHPFPESLGGVDPYAVKGAGFDDSTSPPTLVLCLWNRTFWCNIIFAKPGDNHWTMMNPAQASYPAYDYNRLGRTVRFCSLLSLAGRCYVSSPEGSVYLVEVAGTPRLVEVVDERPLVEKPDTITFDRINSFLVSDGTTAKMLMVRLWKEMEHFNDDYSNVKEEVFTVGGVTNRVEVLEVDVAGRRLLPVTSLGRHAAFLGSTTCVLLSTETFLSIAADAIYLGRCGQQGRGFSIYHVNGKKTEPPHEFESCGAWGVAPGARPCNLDQYLAWYVDGVHGYGADASDGENLAQRHALRLHESGGTHAYAGTHDLQDCEVNAVANAQPCHRRRPASSARTQRPHLDDLELRMLGSASRGLHGRHKYAHEAMT
ncbi:hypothetical protein EJB05_03487, partial [Eragrostis curvula]